MAGLESKMNFISRYCNRFLGVISTRPYDISIIGNILVLLPYKGALCIFGKFSHFVEYSNFYHKSPNKLHSRFESLGKQSFERVVVTAVTGSSATVNTTSQAGSACPSGFTLEVTSVYP
jgi:hypothetical protein